TSYRPDKRCFDDRPNGRLNDRFPANNDLSPIRRVKLDSRVGYTCSHCSTQGARNVMAAEGLGFIGHYDLTVGITALLYHNRRWNDRLLIQSIEDAMNAITLDDRKIFTWHGPQDFDRFANVIAEQAAAELFEVNKTLMWLDAGQLVPVYKNT